MNGQWTVSVLSGGWSVSIRFRMNVERMDTFQEAASGKRTVAGARNSTPATSLIHQKTAVRDETTYNDYSATLWTFTKSQTLSVVLACLTKAVSRMASPISLKAISPDTPL